MKRKFLLLSVASILLTPAGASATSTFGDSTTKVFPASAVTVTRVADTTDGDCNFRNFEVEVPESGDYFVEFWLLPAKYADGSYTSFNISVNNQPVGSISPTFGNY